MFKRLVLTVSAAAFTLALGGVPIAAAATASNSISSVVPTCDSGVVHVTVDVTHQGSPVTVRVVEYSGSTKIDDVDHGFVGNGSDTFVASVQPGHNLTSTAYLQRWNHRTQTMDNLVTPVSTGSYDC
jgi:hypothetical protein